MTGYQLAVAVLWWQWWQWWQWQQKVSLLCCIITLLVYISNWATKSFAVLIPEKP